MSNLGGNGNTMTSFGDQTKESSKVSANANNSGGLKPGQRRPTGPKYEPVNFGKKKPAPSELVEEMSEADENNSHSDMTPVRSKQNLPPPPPAKPQNRSIVRKGTGADFALPKARKFELKPVKKIEEATKLSETSESTKLKIFNQIKQKSQKSTSPVRPHLKKQKSSTKETIEVLANPKRGIGRKDTGVANFKNAAKKSITVDANAINDIEEEEGEEDHSLLDSEIESPVPPPKRRADQQQPNKAGNYGFDVELIAEESESGTIPSQELFTNSNTSDPKPAIPSPKPAHPQNPSFRRKTTSMQLKPIKTTHPPPPIPSLPKNPPSDPPKKPNQKRSKSQSSHSDPSPEVTVDSPRAVNGKIFWQQAFVFLGRISAITGFVPM